MFSTTTDSTSGSSTWGEEEEGGGGGRGEEEVHLHPIHEKLELLVEVLALALQDVLGAVAEVDQLVDDPRGDQVEGRLAGLGGRRSRRRSRRREGGVKGREEEQEEEQSE